MLSTLVIIIGSAYIYISNNKDQDVLGVSTNYTHYCIIDKQCPTGETCRRRTTFRNFVLTQILNPRGFCVKPNTPYICNSKISCGPNLYCRGSNCTPQGDNDSCNSSSFDCGQNRFCQTEARLCRTKCSSDNDCMATKSCIQPSTPNSAKYCNYTVNKCTTNSDCKSPDQYCNNSSGKNGYCQDYYKVTSKNGQVTRYTQQQAAQQIPSQYKNDSNLVPTTKPTR